MKGLLIKDLLSIKSTLMFQVILFFCMGFAFLEVTSPESIYTYTAAAVAISSAFTISSMNSDEKCSWNKYALTTSIERKEIVLSKYLLSLLLMAGGFVISIIVNLIFIKKNQLSWDIDMITALLVSFGAGSLLISVIIPAAIKFKAENARYIMLIFLLALIGLGFASSSMNFSLDSSLSVVALPVIAILAAMILISMGVSIRIFKNKEY